MGAVLATGHGVVSLDSARETPPVDTRPWVQRYLAEIATVGSGLFTLLGAVLAWSGAPESLSTLAYATAIAFGGLLVWRRALISIRAGLLDMNVLMTVAVLGAAALGEWGEGATVYFLFAIGGLLESRALARTRHSIRDLMDLTPPVARVRRGPEVLKVPVGSIGISEMVVVRPGERVPLDGVIRAGRTTLNEAAITGESSPADKGEGDEVWAGTLNEAGLIEVEVTSCEADTVIARIVYQVEEAQASRAPTQQLIDRFARVYTPVVVALAAAVAVVPPLLAALLGVDWGSASEWVSRGLVLLVIGCPCALVIATPVAVVSAITRASRDGVLVKGGVFLETAAMVSAVAFDKTGTLTSGKPVVISATAVDRTAEELLVFAARLESHSAHPIARSIVEAAGPATFDGVEDFSEVPGSGVHALVDGVRVSVAKTAAVRELVSEPFSDSLEVAAKEGEAAGASVLAVAVGDRAVGIIAVADAVRPEAADVTRALRRGGIEHLVMLTGDNESAAAIIAQRVGVDRWFSGLLPAEKTAAINTLRGEYAVVAMVGDGVNDAPALASADIGIAMGAAGSDTALETADVALMRDDLDALPGLFALGRRMRRVIVFNIAFAIGVKAVAALLAVAGIATLWMAVFADTGVALLVIVNGMRLLGPSDSARKVGEARHGR